MRLLWTGVLLLMPLVAELVTTAQRHRCSGSPDAPEHASVRCFKKRGTCRAFCEEGYIFTEKNSQSAIYSCQGGEWVMRNEQVDRCDPVCIPICKNGGYCTAPYSCTCPHGYGGNYCEIPVCDMECLNGGQCVAPNTCGCPLEWTGVACEEHVCDPPCENGVCTEPNSCHCDDGFTGDLCDEEEGGDWDDYYTTEEPTIEDSGEDSDEEEDTEVGRSHTLTSEVEPVTQSQYVEVMVPLKFEAEAKQLVNRLVAVEYMKQKYSHLLVYPEEENSH